MPRIAGRTDKGRCAAERGRTTHSTRVGLAGAGRGRRADTDSEPRSSACSRISSPAAPSLRARQQCRGTSLRFKLIPPRRRSRCSGWPSSEFFPTRSEAQAVRDYHADFHDEPRRLLCRTRTWVRVYRLELRPGLGQPETLRGRIAHGPAECGQRGSPDRWPPPGRGPCLNSSGLASTVSAAAGPGTMRQFTPIGLDADELAPSLHRPCQCPTRNH